MNKKTKTESPNRENYAAIKEGDHLIIYDRGHLLGEYETAYRMPIFTVTTRPRECDPDFSYVAGRWLHTDNEDVIHQSLIHRILKKENGPHFQVGELIQNAHMNQGLVRCFYYGERAQRFFYLVDFLYPEGRTLEAVKVKKEDLEKNYSSVPGTECDCEECQCPKEEIRDKEVTQDDEKLQKKPKTHFKFFKNLEEGDYIIATETSFEKTWDHSPGRRYAMKILLNGGNDFIHVLCRGERRLLREEDLEYVLRKEDHPRWEFGDRVGYTLNGNSTTILGCFWDTQMNAFYYETDGFHRDEVTDEKIKRDEAETLYHLLEYRDPDFLEEEEFVRYSEATKRYLTALLKRKGEEQELKEAEEEEEIDEMFAKKIPLPTSTSEKERLGWRFINTLRWDMNPLAIEDMGNGDFLLVFRGLSLLLKKDIIDKMR